MKSARNFVIAGIGAAIAFTLAVALIAGNVLAGTVNTSEAVVQPSNATTSLTATDQVVLELLNNATTAVNNGNSTQAILDVIQAVKLEHTLRTTTANQTSVSNQTSGLDAPNLFQ